MTVQVLGSCSCCGGCVTVPLVWGGVIPPVPTCQSCGATKRQGGPVIEMVPRNLRDGQTYVVGSGSMSSGLSVMSLCTRNAAPDAAAPIVPSASETFQFKY